jgi:hypothetical protein
MNVANILRRLRGAVGNAAVWGAGWFVATLAVFAALAVAGEPFSWEGAVKLAARTGVMGGIAGGAFSAVIGLLYRGRRLSEISWVRFGVRGGIVAGLFVPVVMIVGRTLSGDGPLPMQNFLSSALVAAVLGGVAAGTSLKLAQRADARLPSRISQDQLDGSEGADRLPSVGEPDTR